MSVAISNLLLSAMVHSMTHHLKGSGRQASIGEKHDVPEFGFENDNQSYQHELGEWDNLNHLIICSYQHSCIIDPFDDF